MNTVDKATDSTENINGHKVHNVEEIQIPVPWGYLSGKWWGPMDQQPIVAIHGWQDNAGTFDKLIPLLPSNVAILAIDLPGHGLSSHLPSGQFYYVFWDGLVILRKWWGPKGIQPIVALHGRQDNAGSFDTLIPLLCDEISVLCLDMPGHGLSSHYPKSQYYYVYWDGIILLRRIVKYFKWKKVKLLGHSLGGAISFLYAAFYPDEVEFMISLDIASPSVKDVAKNVAILSDSIDKFLKYELLQSDSIPSYSYDEVLSIVEDAYKGSITRESAIILMKRGLRPANESERYYFSRDPRLKVSALGTISLDMVLIYATRIKCAYLNIRAIPGLKLDYPESYDKVLDQIKIGAKRFEYHKVEGTHHVHLNYPEKIAPIINSFIST
ncbi:serine hydrolase isoform X3 [Apis mellifera caucasica]|uniref:Probable serine hydrolase isoform X3 n=1 Tax=Apis mellifera TaxID=7460 RepID=A0A7M7L671_APIME|nr:probable serine hydrolase isoform X3 [Apis mellifera]KAG6800186.1 serine hydrolase isoform X3 [Apis mellifera caucasica]KAG9433202.1 serine hydrolase isoform X3 [Apis mellifera carnica]|eukprot:XP_026295662.1 probable serine hydrolase isoform X3 [Apis mellifera]